MLLNLLTWWLVCSAMGWMIWPLSARIFRHSPGRGYAYARALGMVVLAYAYWLGGMAGLLTNTTVAAWGVAGAIMLGGIVLGIKQRRSLGHWLRQSWRHVLVTECLFAAALLIYAAHKAHDPAINHTEEPMDLAFLNAMLHSPRMPPDDPWLAGYAVSYYYLGYLMVSLVARLGGIASGVAYNLGLAQTLALSIVGAYGVLYDLLARNERQAHIWSALGAVAVCLAGNLEGPLELLRARGLGSSAFYRWLDVPGLAEAPMSGTWLPRDPWWWWRASRIISDPNILGKTPTVITEFPAFSLILGDLHPHVMALPYVLMALGLAVELYRTAREREWWRNENLWVLFPLLLGALGMLNSWDLPTLLIISGLAFAAGRWLAVPSRHVWLRDTLLFGAWLGAGSIFLYLPFYRALSTQAQGIGLAYYAKTSLKHYLLHWGLWMVLILGEAVVAGRALRRVGDVRSCRRLFWPLWLALLLLPWFTTLILGGWGRFLLGLVTVILRGPWPLLLQSVLLSILLSSLWRMLRRAGRGWQATGDRSAVPPDHVDVAPAFDRHVLSATGEERGQEEAIFWPRMMMVVGIGLTYVTEYLYLRDVFDTRMNTVFKFYYQAWVLLGLGAASTVPRLWRQGTWQRVVVGLSGLVVCLCLTYPLAAGYTRGDGYGGQPTLDGTAFLRAVDPAVDGAYRWLVAHGQPGDVLVEAPGEEYVAEHNRLSSWTGVPSILGWPGHEIQWRGDDREVRRRMADLERIYTSTDQDEVTRLLARYGATYLYIGAHEREKYQVDGARLQWYAAFLTLAYGEGDVHLFRVPRTASQR